MIAFTYLYKTIISVHNFNVRAGVYCSERTNNNKKLGGPGSVLVMPLTNKDSIWSFDHMDAVEITIPDAPHPDELVIAVVLADGGRPLARVSS